MGKSSMQYHHKIYLALSLVVLFVVTLLVVTRRGSATEVASPENVLSALDTIRQQCESMGYVKAE